MRNISKLNAQGMAHFVLPLLVIAIVAIGGVYMLVSSSASPARIKKTKPVVAVSNADIYDGEFNISGELETKSGNKVPSEQCEGQIQVDVTHRGKKVYSTTQNLKDDSVGCFYSAGKKLESCSQKGKYSIKVKFLGNDYLKAAKHSTIKRVCELPSNAPSSGQTIIQG